jgi:hypothetical protein
MLQTKFLTHINRQQLAYNNNGFVGQVVENETLGRHLIATRDLKVGEVILQEEPLVAGPSQVTPPVCLGCYSLLTEECATACPDCGWPVCSEKCARSSAHRAECDITKLMRKAKVKSLNAGVRGCRPTANKFACCLTTLLITKFV